MSFLSTYFALYDRIRVSSKKEIFYLEKPRFFKPLLLTISLLIVSDDGRGGSGTRRQSGLPPSPWLGSRRGWRLGGAWPNVCLTLLHTTWRGCGRDVEEWEDLLKNQKLLWTDLWRRPGEQMNWSDDTIQLYFDTLALWADVEGRQASHCTIGGPEFGAAKVFFKDRRMEKKLFWVLPKAWDFYLI